MAVRCDKMKDILVTGAYGGMGRATVCLLREKGFRVFALDKNVADGEENVIPIKADLTCGESIKNAFEEVSRRTDFL